jgi:hypothetical protein
MYKLRPVRYWNPKKIIATGPNYSVTRSRININHVRYLPVASPRSSCFWKYMSWVSLSQNWVLS